jgi:hypothetical protein
MAYEVRISLRKLANYLSGINVKRKVLRILIKKHRIMD